MFSKEVSITVAIQNWVNMIICGKDISDKSMVNDKLTNKLYVINVRNCQTWFDNLMSINNTN